MYPLCQNADWRITASLSKDNAGWRLVDIEAGDTRGRHYGIAVDLGSTGVSMHLLDMNSGAVIAARSAVNGQTAFGDEILSRIFYGHDNPEHIEEIRLATVNTIQGLMDDLSEESGIDLRTCPAMVIAGNTTMIHFLLGIDAFTVFMSPYATIANEPEFVPAGDLGLNMIGMIYIYPSKSNYMGGDIVSGAVATGLVRSEEISVFLDTGTNGELLIGGKDFLVAGAGAAGPALEGGVIRTGMRAEPGAVDYLSISGDDIKLSVIGNERPKGICGSGIVDMIAELFLEDRIDFRGRFIPENFKRIEKIEEEWAFRYADAEQTEGGEALYFYQSDIDQFLATKAAAYTMVEYMLNQIGMDISMVDKFYLAGAFGTYISQKSGVAIGLYPDLPEDKIICAGNSSLAGARLLLLDRSLLDEVRRIMDSMVYIQFGEAANFVDIMSSAMGVPHMDADRYPSVKKWKAARGH